MEGALGGIWGRMEDMKEKRSWVRGRESNLTTTQKSYSCRNYFHTELLTNKNKKLNQEIKEK